MERERQMLGTSVYLSNIPENISQYLENMYNLGCRGIFTSLHIPEDDPSIYKERLKLLGELALKFNMELFADISPKSLEHLGLGWEQADQLKDWGLTGLRMDYGLSEEVIASLSKKMKIALNASTIREKNIRLLREFDAEFSNLEAWHNYYPRPETGLALEDFNEINRWLKTEGFTVMAFIPGDGERRRPIFQGLPTIENHRELSTFSAFIDFYHNPWVDKIFIGDPSINEQTTYQFEQFSKGLIVLHANTYLENEQMMKQLESPQTNRPDNARDVIRSAESRQMAVPGSNKIPPFNTVDRLIGSITIDNEKYGRYQGEIQITRRNLPRDEKVNVIGRVVEEDLPILPYIKGGTKFAIRWVE